MKYGKISGLWVSGGVESSGSSGTEQTRERQRKNSDIITVPPTNGPCPHGLMACPLSPGWLPLSSRRVGSLQSIRVPAIEIFF